MFGDNSVAKVSDCVLLLLHLLHGWSILDSDIALATVMTSVGGLSLLKSRMKLFFCNSEREVLDM